MVTVMGNLHLLGRVPDCGVGYDSRSWSADRPSRLDRACQPTVASDPETAAAQRSNPMTGLDLESFLLLLRADLTTWVVLGLATLGLAVLVWSSWRSRRALRNCLVLSLAAHLGLVLYGSTIPAVMWTVGHRIAVTPRIGPISARFASPRWSSRTRRSVDRD